MNSLLEPGGNPPDPPLQAWLAGCGQHPGASHPESPANKLPKVGTTSIPRKSRKKEGGIKGPQARTGGSSGSPLVPLLLKPPKRHREGPGKGANKQNSKKRKLQEYGEMRTSEAFSSGCCRSIGYLGIFAKERRPQRSLRPPRPSDRALSVSLRRMRLLQA